MQFRSQNEIERIRSKLTEVLGPLPTDYKKLNHQKEVLKCSPPLWIHGMSGKGKTVVAHMLALKELEGGLKLTSPMPEPFMIGNLCRQFQERSLAGRDYEPQNFLYILDDADKLKMSEFREEQLFIFFDRCLKLKRKLIVTSQKSMKEFSEMFNGDFIGAVNRRLAAIFTEVEL